MREFNENLLHPALPAPQTYQLESCRLELFKRGSRRYDKVSYPLRCGIYHEIDTPSAVLHFNLNQQLIRLIGKHRDWPHPQEWLKRTAGNDWIYYSTGGYTGVFETTGEFYLPNLPYPTNNHLGGKPMEKAVIRALVGNWPTEIEKVADLCSHCPEPAQKVLDNIRAQTPQVLEKEGEILHHIVGGPITVLPPDTRHVDYQIIPLNISTGCLYKCGFCRVKSHRAFTQLPISDIDAQLTRLKELFATDLVNFNSIFLGQHDALHCDQELIRSAIEKAQQVLGLAHSYLDGCNTYLFGSVGSLLAAPSTLFDSLEALPGSIYINIGLESADQQTLDSLNKPVRAGDVSAAFGEIQSINSRYPSIEITANFVTDPELPDSHYRALLSLIRDSIEAPKDKGCVYLSPLRFDDPSRARLFDFYKLKRLSRVPLFMYTIQRL